jgi:hypothetical protein
MNWPQLVPDSMKAVMLPTVQVTALQNGPFLPHIAVRVVLVFGTMQHYTALMIGEDVEGKRFGVIWIFDNFHGRLEENHRLGFDPSTFRTH